MIPREILKKIRQIELRTNRLVNETLAGQYHSVFKGQGMNFDEVREEKPMRELEKICIRRQNHASEASCTIELHVVGSTQKVLVRYRSHVDHLRPGSQPGPRHRARGKARRARLR